MGRDGGRGDGDGEEEGMGRDGGGGDGEVWR